MSSLTDIAMKSMENDTQLVSTLYRTHKSLPPTAKVSSLYVFDALSRAAKHHLTKNGLSSDAKSITGNCATFLSKIEGVLEGLFQDMMTIGNAEAKEKTKKILDIWVKGSTFPPKILTRLSSLVERTEKVPEVPISSGAVVDPRISIVQPAITTPPATAPPTPAMDAQATLLALLAQAAQAATVPVQTSTNTGVDTAQLALLQQLALAQTANNGAPSQPAPPQAHPAMSQSAFPSPLYREEPNHNSHLSHQKDLRSNGPQSSERVNAYDDQVEKSRSRPENDGKDEFGRDIRPQSPDNDKAFPKDDTPQSPRHSSPARASTPVLGPSTSQITSEPAVDFTTAPTSNHDQMSLSPLITANSSSNIGSATIVSSTASSTASTQPGLESFDPMTFDFTSPASWEALGKMWHVTKGYLPSTEELSQFVFTSGQAAFAPMVQTQKWQDTPNSKTRRGGGGGYNRGRGGFHNNVRNTQEEWGQYEVDNQTDAIVLGGESGTPDEETGMQVDSNTTDEASHTGPGGKMQRIGDKWVFIREPVSI
ncbi:hypothetical protein C0992_008937 [Termitomyces sp. T32_za158]|nr:hypothetical protein C0992_008937 [Termitomyces sp. T32_za158]